MGSIGQRLDTILADVAHGREHSERVVLQVTQVLIGGHESTWPISGRINVLPCTMNGGLEVQQSQQRGQHINLRAHLFLVAGADELRRIDNARNVILVNGQRRFACT